ncbi:hypothetical protein DPEC_G00083500 [Dallia pectoralis]|uniref:Uncharacterized protein n=1 Tax=Dallia pectoralis TaxID=75939 RepID=A0ACC2GZ15_DALPE|nr:hypothetical protein DPEC_G00083500 [Dallia pectoralis]
MPVVDSPERNDVPSRYNYASCYIRLQMAGSSTVFPQLTAGTAPGTAPGLQRVTQIGNAGASPLHGSLILVWYKSTVKLPHSRPSKKWDYYRT